MVFRRTHWAPARCIATVGPNFTHSHEDEEVSHSRPSKSVVLSTPSWSPRQRVRSLSLCVRQSPRQLPGWSNPPTVGASVAAVPGLIGPTSESSQTGAVLNQTALGEVDIGQTGAAPPPESAGGLPPPPPPPRPTLSRASQRPPGPPAPPPVKTSDESRRGHLGAHGIRTLDTWSPRFPEDQDVEDNLEGLVLRMPEAPSQTRAAAAPRLALPRPGFAREPVARVGGDAAAARTAPRVSSAMRAPMVGGPRVGLPPRLLLERLFGRVGPPLAGRAARGEQGSGAADTGEATAATAALRSPRRPVPRRRAPATFGVRNRGGAGARCLAS